MSLFQSSVKSEFLVNNCSWRNFIANQFKFPILEISIIFDMSSVTWPKYAPRQYYTHSLKEVLHFCD